MIDKPKLRSTYVQVQVYIRTRFIAEYIYISGACTTRCKVLLTHDIHVFDIELHCHMESNTCKYMYV